MSAPLFSELEQPFLPGLDKTPVKRAKSALNLNSPSDHALHTARGRLYLLMFGLSLGLALVTGRLFDVMILQQIDRGAYVNNRPPLIESLRADLTDRNGQLLATSVATTSLYADPKLILDVDEAVAKLSSVLPELEPEKLRQLLTTKQRFVWLKRHLTPRQHYDVNRLGLPGINFFKDQRRLYPQGPLVAHIVGYTSVDNTGISGVEKSLEAQLFNAEHKPVALSVDLRLQHIIRRELQRTITDFNAIGGAGIVMDIQTGEVLALVSLPDFDPHHPGNASDEALFSRATLGVYEMGSTFKIFNAAMALESGKVKLTDSFDTINPIKIGRFEVDDFTPVRRYQTVPEIMVNSSNIGSARMALLVGGDAQQAFLRKLGLLGPSQINLPENGSPIVPKPWREASTITIAFGHGIAVSAIQTLTAFSTLIRGGHTLIPTLLKQAGPQVPPPNEPALISASTLKQVKQLIRLVVTNGTAKGANAKGYLVGGKTGTAEKTTGKRYSENARLSSFVGAFPMTSPRYAVMIMVDEPKGSAKTHGYATGGWVAAPTVGRIISQMGPLYGIAPIEETPAIQRALRVPSYPYNDGLEEVIDDREATQSVNPASATDSTPP